MHRCSYRSAEAALLIVDYFSTTESACTYGIFVLEPYRRRGVGMEMLRYAEARARELGCRQIQLEVHPLDASIDKKLLRAWYTKHGYEQEEGSPNKVHKVFGVMPR